MTRQDDLNTLLEDLLMLRAELEAMDIGRGGWEAALNQRHLRQQRQDLEDALQARMAELGSKVLDALMERREDALLSIARGPLGVAALPTQDEGEEDDGDDGPDDSSGPAGGQGDDEPPAPPSTPQAIEVASDDSPAAAQQPKSTPQPAPEPEAPLAVEPVLASPADAPTLERAKILSTPAIDPASIAQLKSKMISNSLGFDDDRIFESAALHFIKLAWEVAGATPAELKPKSQMRRELSALEELVNRQRLLWRSMPNTPHLELCCWVVARLRALEQAIERDFSNRVEELARLKALYPKMIHHVRPLDYVHGLSPKHSPRHGQWRDDARFFERSLRQRLGLETPLKAQLKASNPKASCKGDFNLDDALRCLIERVREGMEPEDFVAALYKLLQRKVVIHQETRVVNLAVEFADALEGDKTLKPLRRAVRKQIEAASREAESSQQPALPVDWPWLEHTLGKRCELIGGDPRQHRIQAIQDAFGFDELQWCESGPRHVQSLIERVKSGKVDMVIILRCFCAHRISIPLFKLRKSGAAPDFKLVQADAYGIQQLRAGVERFMQEAEA